MVQINAPVADFSVQAFHNEDIKNVKLSGFKGKWVVLLFYPADFTFICPTELKDAADLYADFQAEGAEVMSVSTDTVYTHKAWHDTSEAIKTVKYPMLADTNGNLCRQFGTYQEASGLSLRASFIIDPDGVLLLSEVHNNSIGRNAAEILRKLQAAKFVREHNGEVCPANWKPGAKTLKPGLDLVGKI